MRRLCSLALLTALAVLSLCYPVRSQPADTGPKKTAADLLARETDQMLEERNLRPAVYNGVKFLALVAQGKINQADGVFLTRGRARQALQEGHVLDTLRQLDFRPPFRIQCVGFNAMSLDAVTLVYIGTTEDGPVGVKLYIYKHETGVYIGRVDVADDWTELERMTATELITRLPAPLVINVTASKDGTGDVESGDSK